MALTKMAPYKNGSIQKWLGNNGSIHKWLHTKMAPYQNGSNKK
jgi:hypothetical protein